MSTHVRSSMYLLFQTTDQLKKREDTASSIEFTSGTKPRNQYCDKYK